MHVTLGPNLFGTLHFLFFAKLFNLFFLTSECMAILRLKFDSSRLESISYHANTSCDIVFDFEFRINLQHEDCFTISSCLKRPLRRKGNPKALVA
jgi:hypothetical protein